MGKSKRSRGRPGRRVSCQHHWHEHGAPGGLHVWCCHCGAGVEVIYEGAGLRARFLGVESPPADLVELVEGLVLVRRQLAG